MTRILKISMTGFKSFGERTVTINIPRGFTCFVGPNDVGKSNIIDALSFCLGRLSRSTIRSKDIDDLIYVGTKGIKSSNRASVTISFNNSDGIFPGGKKLFDITRTIDIVGGGGYKMNGIKATQHEILKTLASANINPVGSKQFFLQEKIIELIDMNDNDRRRFIEELIGLRMYDEMKATILKELKKTIHQDERKAMEGAIEKIELSKTKSFINSYHKINREFSRVYQLLNPEESAKMILDNSNSPFKGGISIEALHNGVKDSLSKSVSIDEKTLWAYALIFAVQKVYPAPFYVMDDVDTLNGSIAHSISKLIKRFSILDQYIVISQREECIANSDCIYSVSMQENGITDIFKVDFEEAKGILGI